MLLNKTDHPSHDILHMCATATEITQILAFSSPTLHYAVSSD